MQNATKTARKIARKIESETVAPVAETVAETVAPVQSESVAVIHADLIAHMRARGLVSVSPQFHTDGDKAGVKLAVSGHRDNTSGRALSDRSVNLYRAARDVYGDKHFRARGLDNSIIAMLCANGYFAIASGGETYADAKLAGVTRIRDAADSPVMLRALSRKA